MLFSYSALLHQRKHENNMKNSQFWMRFADFTRPLVFGHMKPPCYMHYLCEIQCCYSETKLTTGCRGLPYFHVDFTFHHPASSSSSLMRCPRAFQMINPSASYIRRSDLINPLWTPSFSPSQVRRTRRRINHHSPGSGWKFPCSYQIPPYWYRGGIWDEHGHFQPG